VHDNLHDPHDERARHDNAERDGESTLNTCDRTPLVY